MRLINTTTFTFQEHAYKTVEYAIVSHRWGDDEVSYQEFLQDRAGLRAGLGWKKIIHGCRLAKTSGLEWLWIDTCCINKDSSSELTEAINSMYAWYERSKVCYVYLPDVAAIPEHKRRTSEVSTCDPTKGVPFYPDEFKSSSWFTRGWTLQELLAPRQMSFYNSVFEYIGSKSFLMDHLVEGSGIDRIYLDRYYTPRRASIAERMGWAAQRTTTKEEDLAYCLLGLFKVNMPLLYGEGSIKAFVRLQLEIIKMTDDETVFAWEPDNIYWNGLLAQTPACFVLSSGKKGHRPFISRLLDEAGYQFRHPYAMTNKGLEFTLDIPTTNVVGETVDYSWGVHVVLPLNCELMVSGDRQKRFDVAFESIVQPAVVLLVRVALDNEILLGKRSHLLQVNFVEPGKFKVLGPADSSLPREHPNRVVVGSAGPTKRWKVYISQDGL